MRERRERERGGGGGGGREDDEKDEKEENTLKRAKIILRFKFMIIGIGEWRR